jgi:signal transduction histidine kinase
VAFLAGRAVRRMAAPIGEVMEAADRVAGGDYSARVQVRGSGEVARLTHAFNQMTARLQANEAQRRALLADVAHELRTPLSVIRGNRHTPPGGAVRVLLSPAQAGVAFAVSDTGPGIDARDLPHVFDRFVKSADSGGAGLGLAIARSLVEAHGGRITAESAPGAGTTMRFVLPAVGNSSGSSG